MELVPHSVSSRREFTDWWRDQTARHQTGRKPNRFFRSEYQAGHLAIDDRECRPSSVSGIDLGFFCVVPANKERLLSVPVLEIAVVGIRGVSVDLRLLFTTDVMIRDRKQWRPSWLVHETLPRCDMIDGVARRTTKGVRIEFLKSKPRVLAFTTWPTGDELTGAEDILHQAAMRAFQQFTISGKNAK